MSCECCTGIDGGSRGSPEERITVPKTTVLHACSVFVYSCGMTKTISVTFDGDGTSVGVWNVGGPRVGPRTNCDSPPSHTVFGFPSARAKFGTSLSFVARRASSLGPTADACGIEGAVCFSTRQEACVSAGQDSPVLKKIRPGNASPEIAPARKGAFDVSPARKARQPRLYFNSRNWRTPTLGFVLPDVAFCVPTTQTKPSHH